MKTTRLEISPACTEIATKLDTERAFDVAGNICDDNDVQGRKSRYKMDHP
jgi:hypothetical protein